MSYSRHLADDTLAIYLFHGVVRESPYPVRNYTRKHLTAAVFRQILQDLKAHGTPVSMQEVLQSREGGAPLPPRAFAITFDDGFENNVSVAAPLLADLDIPATFYVTTDFVDRNRMSWIDRIEYCLERAAPGALTLPWDGSRHPFGDAASKIALLTHLRRVMKSDPAIDVEAFAEEVFHQCGMPPVSSSDDPLNLKMSWAQAAQLHRHGLFIVGGHSHKHTNLAFLGAAELRREVATSIDLLADKAGIRSLHYSYPEGLEHCFSDQVIEVLREHGVRCCPTAIEGVNGPQQGPFHLRRVAVI